MERGKGGCLRNIFRINEKAISPEDIRTIRQELKRINLPFSPVNQVTYIWDLKLIEEWL